MSAIQAGYLQPQISPVGPGRGALVPGARLALARQVVDMSGRNRLGSDSFYVPRNGSKTMLLANGSPMLLFPRRTETVSYFSYGHCDTKLVVSPILLKPLDSMVLSSIQTGFRSIDAAMYIAEIWNRFSYFYVVQSCGELNQFPFQAASFQRITRNISGYYGSCNYVLMQFLNESQAVTTDVQYICVKYHTECVIPISERVRVSDLAAILM